jgi:cytochrome c oxidase cbb3-type subunit III
MRSLEFRSPTTTRLAMSDVKRKDEIQGDIVHEYDGIEEADNHLPTWWLITFFGAIAFGAVYWSVYEGYGLLQSANQEYHVEQAAIDEASGALLGEAEIAAYASDETRVSTGRAVFAQNCVVCHGALGEGKIGPNLTDNRWLHGGDARSIFRTVRVGVAAKNMPPWGNLLGPVRTQAVTAFVLSLRNTNAAGGKEPQGEVYEPAAAPPGH